MKQLVRLEMKKINMRSIEIIGGVTSSILFIYLLIWGLGISKGQTDISQQLCRVISYNKIAFTIFIAVLINKLFSDEISSRSLSILFTYPISRLKLLEAKIILIAAMGISFMYASMLVQLILLGLGNAVFHFLQGTLTIGIVVQYIISALLQSILASVTACIPLYAAVKYASAQGTVIAAGVMALFLYSHSGSAFFGVNLLLLVITAAIGAVMVKRSLAFIMEKDIM